MMKSLLATSNSLKQSETRAGIFLCALKFGIVFLLLQGACAEPTKIQNSIGMTLVKVPAGSFFMGNTNTTPSSLNGPPHLQNGDWDEQPVHKVTFSREFLIGQK